MLYKRIMALPTQMSGTKANSPWVLLKLEIVLLSQLDKWKAFDPNLTRKKKLAQVDLFDVDMLQSSLPR